MGRTDSADPASGTEQNGTGFLAEPKCGSAQFVASK